MYKFKAKLIVNQEVIAEANTLEDIEAAVLGYRRKQKTGEHTSGNEKIEIIHVERDSLKGKHKSKEVILKVI
ncbi:MAG6790 family protein [Mycoplasma tauri]|uniref:Uncharacterized protein n=1 Tax=Mycoplasma tauri TaxID=547987 RepID=A0A953NDZ6_9MOLU|nr:hypothetical protein [Mycoplasma tauri]MBZ4195168.1 hypothetical protein [Mycoplasma tauri]MBZ4203369.1 hypothetical protein [Mycoplasma tauri]MBZ4204226.1 hypothetical protein [Mycoplasma tauri]MBZ4212713.1 hypothetical protein [Mycoplasma tauri]MBZ4218019.1 hypothetical protein [Mycoplasma tauri]